MVDFIFLSPHRAVVAVAPISQKPVLLHALPQRVLEEEAKESEGSEADEEPLAGLQVEGSMRRKLLAGLPGPNAGAWTVLSPVSGEVVTGWASSAHS